jgi:hypothetical protein
LFDRPKPTVGFGQWKKKKKKKYRDNCIFIFT